ncbi:hypothetical protein MRO89_03170 [Dickeya dianthicola]|nr:hypothetical protein [Dickeya dianthicola]MCI4184972.1 hypothetical protein [Dickeya dianthicola]MCI4236096.1 hypothetical protein [Dickeya dianthicola]MCI4253307.1 hypothetical protein [Dickeya dianthicola]QOL16004.1 hypothetical protein HGI48_18435 [Dickeya dianthicola]
MKVKIPLRKNHFGNMPHFCDAPPKKIVLRGARRLKYCRGQGTTLSF